MRPLGVAGDGCVVHQRIDRRCPSGPVLPTPLGQIVEYLPSLNETLVCLGIWAFGILMYVWMLHVAIPIMNGSLRSDPNAVDRES